MNPHHICGSKPRTGEDESEVVALEPVVEGVEGDGEGEDVGQRPAEVEHEVELGDRDQQKPTQEKNWLSLVVRLRKIKWKASHEFFNRVAPCWFWLNIPPENILQSISTSEFSGGQWLQKSGGVHP